MLSDFKKDKSFDAFKGTIDVQKWVDWHESIMLQYPYEVQSQFRDARTKMIAHWYKSKLNKPI